MEPDKPTRDPYGTYLAIQAAVRQIEDYTVPDAELDAFILQGDLRPTSMGGVSVYKNGSATVMGYIRMRWVIGRSCTYDETEGDGRENVCGGTDA